MTVFSMAASSPAITVVVPTHNPHAGRLARTLDGLRLQTLPAATWELILVDNAGADPAFFAALDLAWHPHARVVPEPKLGLTAARLRGFAESRGELVVLVDDDNVLAPDYLAQAAHLAALHPPLGAFGGRSLPEFETPPPAWTAEFFHLLALRDLGAAPQTAELAWSDDKAHRVYPRCAPIGAGMVLRRPALSAWMAASGDTTLTDRRGGELSSGGDNDIVLSVLRVGWQVGYFPELTLTHLIPSGRLAPDYLAKLNRGIQKSWMQVLARHQASPWPPIARWTVPLRQLKAWWVYRGWSRPAGRIRWQGACGHFAGRATEETTSL